MRFLWDPLTLPARHRVLLRRLARREFEARYRGSILGLAWAVITPVAMMAVYTFVFHSVLAARWPGHAVDDRMGYALNLLAGLIVFNVIAECLGRAPRLILENPSYVKKLVFPVEILPVVALLGAMISASIGCLVLLLIQWTMVGPPSLAILLLPLLVMPLLFVPGCYLSTGSTRGISARYRPDHRPPGDGTDVFVARVLPGGKRAPTLARLAGTQSAGGDNRLGTGSRFTRQPALGRDLFRPTGSRDTVSCAGLPDIHGFAAQFCRCRLNFRKASLPAQDWAKRIRFTRARRTA
ncbi:MAG: ABC transporter permease [Ferrovum myxofaciens]